MSHTASRLSPHSRQAGQARPNIIFAVIAVVLLIAAAAGIYFAKQRSDSLSESGQKQPVAVNTPKPTSQNEQKKGSSNSKSDSNSSSQKQSKTPATTPTSPNSSTPAPSTSTELPSTGPTDTLAALLVFPLLTFSALAYIRSRHPFAAARS